MFGVLRETEAEVPSFHFSARIPLILRLTSFPLQFPPPSRPLFCFPAAICLLGAVNTMFPKKLCFSEGRYGRGSENIGSCEIANYLGLMHVQPLNSRQGGGYTFFASGCNIWSDYTTRGFDAGPRWVSSLLLALYPGIRAGNGDFAFF